MSDSRSRSGPVLQAAIIFLLSLALTGVVWWTVREQNRALAEVRFSSVAGDIVRTLAARMRDYEQILRAGVGLLYAADDVDRADWQIFVERLRVDDTYPGILGIGFAQRVDPEEVAEHQDAVRAEGFHDYLVRPPPETGEAYPIIWLEPFNFRNRQAFGYDMFSEDTRRSAMARARDTGRASLSGPVTLVQEITPDVQAGVLLYLPVYAGERTPETVEQRREEIVGFVYSPFRVGDLITAVLGEWLDDAVVRVYDGSPVTENRLFGPPLPASGDFVETRVLELYGREWTVIASSQPLGGVMDSPEDDLVLASGLTISVLLTWLAYTRAQERARRFALAESHASLLQARAEADAAAAAKTHFLAAASHDIRQPVQSMVLLTSILQRQLSDHPSAHLVDQLDQAAAALRTLLDGLLDISKLDAGVITPDLRPVRLDELLARLHTEYRLRAAERGLRLRMVECSQWVLTDAALLERILRNILENAVRYTERGGILLGCRRRGDWVGIQVIDTGIGIHPHDRDAIFQEFYQIGNPERDRGKGLGLGLAIVRRIATLLGHRLDVSSRPGFGSAFEILVPLAEPQETEDVPHRPGGQPGAAPRVLVIDDEEMVRQGLVLMLREWGCDVVAAGDAEEAVAMAAENPPDVVLADYRLREGRTGLEAVDRLRRYHRHRIPAVVLTGDTAPERIAEAARSGLQVLHKPVRAQDLRRALAEATGRG